MEGIDRFRTELRRNRQERKYLALFMKGLPEPIILAIADEDVEPFRQRLFSPTKEMTSPSPFYRLSTFDGKEALISLPDIDYVNFLFQAEEPLTFLLHDSAGELQARAKEDQDDDTATLYFRGRSEPLSIRVKDSSELKQILKVLAKKKTEKRPAFARFTDEQGEVIAFRPVRLVLLIAHRGSIQLTTDADYEALFRAD